MLDCAVETQPIGTEGTLINMARAQLSSQGLQRRYALYYEWKGEAMGTENLLDLISNLTPEQQESVREFVEFLQKGGPRPPSRFLAAADEFIDQHPELLRRLAQ